MSTNLDNVAPAAATEGGSAGGPQWLMSIESAAGTAIEYIAALLMVAEIVVLFAGAVSRYVFHQPILWSDELASTLFLWLAMLGAVVALRRDEHMRMTAIVGMVSPSVCAFLDVLAVAAALEISNAWRASALPIGSALMLLIALMRLLEVSNWRLVGGAVAVIAAGIAIVFALKPVLFELDNINLLIFFVGIVALNVFAGVPIAFSVVVGQLGDCRPMLLPSLSRMIAK